MTESQQDFCPKPGPPSKRVCELARELGVSEDELVTFLFSKGEPILSSSDIVPPSRVMEARLHCHGGTKGRSGERPGQRRPNKPRSRNAKRGLANATRELFGTPTQRPRSHPRDQGPDYVKATRNRFPIQVASDEEALMVVEYWAARDFSFSEVQAWWDGGLGLRDAGLAFRARNVGLKPTDLPVVLEGRTVIQRIRDNESLERISSRLQRMRKHYSS